MKSRKHALRTVTMIGVLIAAHAVAKEPPEDADWYEEYREMQDRAADGGQAFTPNVDVLEQSQASGRGARAEGGDTFSAEHASIDELQREIDRQATIARYYETLDSRMAWQEYVENYGTGAELEDLYFLEAFSRGDHRYGRFFHGGAYYEVAAGDDTEFIPNPLYDPIPPLEEWKPVEMPELNLTRQRPFYRSFLENPEGFRYLAEPEKFREAFALYGERALKGK